MYSMQFRFWCSVAIFGFFTSCADVTFHEDASAYRCQQFNQDCVTKNGIDYFDYRVCTGNEKVDILFVGDNSGSMYPEQKKMGEKFPNFLSALGNLDYHIGVTTTDVTGTGARGALVGPVLNPRMGDVEAQFLNMIKRPETLACDNGGSCPSSDERAIYAAHETLNRGGMGLFRQDADHTAIVILSDEDERSNGGRFTGYELDPQWDTPRSLVDHYKSAFPHKTLSVHAIIVRPGDSACLEAQRDRSRNIRGYYGNVYKELHQMTNDQPLGNICASNYSNEMRQLGTGVKKRALDLPLACISGDFQLAFENSADQVGFNINHNTSEVEFDQPLSTGTCMRLSYSCPSM